MTWITLILLHMLHVAGKHLSLVFVLVSLCSILLWQSNCLALKAICDHAMPWLLQDCAQQLGRALGREGLLPHCDQRVQGRPRQRLQPRHRVPVRLRRPGLLGARLRPRCRLHHAAQGHSQGCHCRPGLQRPDLLKELAAQGKFPDHARSHAYPKPD